MLDANLQAQLREYFQRIEKPVALVYAPGSGDELKEKRAELLELLGEMVAAAPQRSGRPLLSLREDATPHDDHRPVRFSIESDGHPTGVSFDGVPGGHELSSLVLAILQAGGVPIKLDAGAQNAVRALAGEYSFETIVSLDCHNCPDVVQTLNAFALLNPNIKNVMIDGALFPQLLAERRVQGTPAVFLNGRPFATGRLDAARILDKLLALAGDSGGDSPVVEDEQVYDVAIVGGGPAGVAAAVYSARKGLSVTLIAEEPGGQVSSTLGIENLISVFETTGPQLAGTLAEQLRRHAVRTRTGVRVRRVYPAQATSAPHVLELNTNQRVRTRTLLVATGARWRELGVPGEKENIGQGVAFCPHCDGPFFKGKDVAVVGGGNSGVEAALDLSGIVRSVRLLEFAPQLKADATLVARLADKANITVITDARTTEVRAADGRVRSLHYVDQRTQNEHALELDGVFVQIGLVPNSGFVRDVVEVNRLGEIVVDDHGRTSVPGIFACGDVTTTPYKQIVVAMGDGARAALAACEYLLQQPAPLTAALSA